MPCLKDLSVSGLHKHLLGLSKEEQQSFIAQLPSRRRCELAAYIRSLEASIAITTRHESDKRTSEPPFPMPEEDVLKIAMLRARAVRLRLSSAMESKAAAADTVAPNVGTMLPSWGAAPHISVAAACASGFEKGEVEEERDDQPGKQDTRVRLVRMRKELLQLQLRRANLLGERNSGSSSTVWPECDRNLLVSGGETDEQARREGSQCYNVLAMSDSECVVDEAKDTRKLALGGATEVEVVAQSSSHHGAGGTHVLADAARCARLRLDALRQEQDSMATAIRESLDGADQLLRSCCDEREDAWHRDGGASSSFSAAVPTGRQRGTDGDVTAALEPLLQRGLIQTERRGGLAPSSTRDGVAAHCEEFQAEVGNMFHERWSDHDLFGGGVEDDFDQELGQRYPSKDAAMPEAMLNAMMRYRRLASPEEWRETISALPEGRLNELIDFIVTQQEARSDIDTADLQGVSEPENDNDSFIVGYDSSFERARYDEFFRSFDEEDVDVDSSHSEAEELESEVDSADDGIIHLGSDEQSTADGGDDDCEDYDENMDDEEEDEDDEWSAETRQAEEDGERAAQAKLLGATASFAGSSAVCVADIAPGESPNTQPLGRLQLGGATRVPLVGGTLPDTVISSWALDSEVAERKACELNTSGVDGMPIRAWLNGEISGALCRAQVLEVVARGASCKENMQRDVSRTGERYGKGGAGLGGCLGGLAGGFAEAATPQASGVFDVQPREAVCCAATALQASSDLERLIDELNVEVVNLQFRRQCLQTHPQREQGDLNAYLRVHCHLEIIHQSLRLAGGLITTRASSALNVGCSPLDDLSEIEEELRCGDHEAADAAKKLDPEELNARNRRMNHYILDLAWQKDSLTAMLEELAASEAYAILSVLPTDSDADLARAYKAAAKRLHPDKGGDAEQFKTLRGAYERILEARGGRARVRGSSVPSTPTRTPAQGVGVNDDAATKGKRQHERAHVVSSPVEMGEKKGAMVDHEKQRRYEGEQEDEDDGDEVSPESFQHGRLQQTDVVADMGAGASSSLLSPPQSEVATEEHESQCEWETEDETTSAGTSCGRPAASRCQPSPSASSARAASLLPAISVEAISGQAEHALNAAEMCVKVAQLAQGVIDAVGSRASKELLDCTTHLLDMAHLVTEASRSVGRAAASVPAEVMPLLECVRVTKDPTANIVAASRDLMRCTEVISERGFKAIRVSDLLLTRSKGMLESIGTFAGTKRVSEFACHAIAEFVGGIASAAQDAADTAAAAAVMVGEAQRCAQTLAQLVDRLKKHQDEVEERRQGVDSADSDSDVPETLEERRVSTRRLAQKLNGEVLSLQDDLCVMVASSPHLLPEVTVAKKESIFALVAELVQKAKHAISKCWRTASCSADGGKNGTSGAWARSVEDTLRFVSSAAAWRQVASPSFEARVLRVAALIDSGLLLDILRRELLEHCLALAPEELDPTSLKSLTSRLSAAITGLCRRHVP